MCLWLRLAGRDVSSHWHVKNLLILFCEYCHIDYRDSVTKERVKHLSNVESKSMKENIENPLNYLLLNWGWFLL